MNRKEKAALLRSIERKSYLKDENLLRKEFEERKEGIKEYIKKIQTLSIEELMKPEMESVKKYQEECISWYIDENGQKYEYALKEFKELKEKALRISKKNTKVSKEDEQNLLDGFSVSDLLTLTPEELVDRQIAIIKQKCDQRISNSIENFKAKKVKYSGITEEELDEYAGLLTKQEILDDKIELRKEEELLNNNVSYEGYLFTFRESYGDWGYYSHDISNVERIPYYLEEIKKSRKKGLSSALKYLSAYGLTMGTIMGAGIYALSESLLTSLLGMVGGVGAIAVISSLYGAEVLRDILHNKKVVKRLHETGLYDMFVEAARMEKEIEEFEISKEMR